MTATDQHAARTGTWLRRLATLVVVWALTWLFTSWLQMRPDPLGVFAATGLLFTTAWWATDRASGWDPVVWEGSPVGWRLRTAMDTRISYLHRLIDDAVAGRDDGPDTASAAGLQNILRDAAVDRLRMRAAASGVAHLPEDGELIAHTDPTLAAYLLAKPPPPVTRQTVTDIIDRIEAL